jgi:cytochrome P450
LKYINAIIKESLRMFPPVSAISLRNLSKPIKVGPHIIPKNVLCSLNVWQIHHHPKFWDDPERYNPERFMNNEKRHPFAWIPFVSGPRNWYVYNDFK